MLGVHWIADATECAVDRLQASALREALIELPERLGLRRVSEPLIFEGSAAGTRSIAGVVLLAESHASVHLFPEARSLHADVFSCRPFDVSVARELVAAYFGAAAIRESVVRRGIAPSSP